MLERRDFLFRLRSQLAESHYYYTKLSPYLNEHSEANSSQDYDPSVPLERSSTREKFRSIQTGHVATIKLIGLGACTTEKLQWQRKDAIVQICLKVLNMSNDIQIQLSRPSVSLIVGEALKHPKCRDIVSKATRDPVLRRDMLVHARRQGYHRDFLWWQLWHAVIRVGNAVVVALVGNILAEFCVTGSWLTVRIHGHALVAVLASEFDSSVDGCSTAQRVAGHDNVRSGIISKSTLDTREGLCFAFFPWKRLAYTAAMKRATTRVYQKVMNPELHLAPGTY
jgi:hypothetical protein